MNQEAKFTPGPWKIVQHLWPGWSINAVDGTHICGFALMNYKREMQSFKNAELIAAAPELYAMVEKLADELYGVLAVFAGDGDEDFPLVDEARRLLAKALGEEVEK